MKVLLLQPKNDNVFQINHYSFMNIGHSIREMMKKRGLSATRLAKEIPCERTNVYNIFSRKDIGTKLLWRISEVLDHNFFEDFAKEFNKAQQKAK